MSELTKRQRENAQKREDRLNRIEKAGHVPTPEDWELYTGYAKGLKADIRFAKNALKQYEEQNSAPSEKFASTLSLF